MSYLNDNVVYWILSRVVYTDENNGIKPLTISRLWLMVYSICVFQYTYVIIDILIEVEIRCLILASVMSVRAAQAGQL